MKIKYSLLAAAIAILVLTACEGKKSLDGYPMDKPPPSAYAPRDSEPVFDEPAIDDADTTTSEESSDNDDKETTEAEKVSAVTEDATVNEEEAADTNEE